MKVWGVAGWKNTGKTGLTERLVAEFTSRGLRVSTIKNAHHSADVDHPGTDSFRHRAAGASEVILATPHRVAHMHELREDRPPSLVELLDRLGPCDLVLVEGFKAGPHPRIETHRVAAAKPLLAREDNGIRAVASDVDLPGLACPVFDLDATGRIADFITAELGL